MRILKFLVSGLIGLSVNLSIFRLLSHLGVSYLTCSVVAFVAALFVGFILQKYWTFDGALSRQTHVQFLSYTILALTNLAVNTLIVYLLVEYAHMYPLLAQAIGAGSVAFVSYVLYQRYIFTTEVE